MITKEVIDGRPAVISYINDSLEPVNRDEATMIKIIFEDGEIRFGVKAPKDRLKSQWQSHKRRAMKLLEKHGDHDQSTHGNWADGGGGDEDDDKGGGKLPPSEFTRADGKPVLYERSPFTKNASDPKSASSLLQYEWSVSIEDVEAKVPGSKAQVAAARAKVEKEPDTQKLYKNVPTGKKDAKGKEIYRYDPQRAALHKTIIAKLLTQAKIDAARPKPGEKSTLYILGGRGGSGKGWYTDGERGGTLASMKGKAIYINNDDVKEMLPEYKGWNAGPLHEEASDIAEEVERFARENGLNVIVDATLKSEGSLEKRMKEYKAAGYKISGHYMYASPATAAQRALERFVGGNDENGEGGRFVPPEYTLVESTTNENTFDNFRDQMDHWEIYDNMKDDWPKPPRLHSRKGD